MKVAENLYLEHFPQGAELAAKREGTNVIIDTFRASNTIIALLKFCSAIIPISTVEEAIHSDAEVLVGENGGIKPDGFHFTNSPILIERIGHTLRGKKVVLRTTNGTQGLLKSEKANEILIASPRNLKTIIDYLSQKLNEGQRISIISMGTFTSGGYRKVPEDDLTAQLIIQGLKGNDPQWTDEMLFQKVFEDKQYYRKKVETIGRDITYCLEINKTSIIPKYNPSLKIICRLKH